MIDLDDYRIEFCSYIYELLQEDEDNMRANAIIDMYDELFTIAEKLYQEELSKVEKS